METETTTWSEFQNGRKAIVEPILAPEERNKSRRAGLWESQSGIWVGKLIIWVRSFEIRNIITEFTSLISSTKIGKPVLMMDVKVLKDKNISRWVDRENLIYYQVGQLLTAVWLWTSHILLKKSITYTRTMSLTPTFMNFSLTLMNRVSSLATFRRSFQALILCNHENILASQ